MNLIAPFAAYVAVVAALTTTAGYFVFGRANPAVPGLRLWAWGAALQAAGLTVMCLRGFISTDLSGFLTILLASAGFMLFLGGVRVYGGRPARLDIGLAAVAALVVGLVPLTVGWPSAGGRALLFSVFFALCSGLIIRELHRLPDRGARLPRNAAIGVFTLVLATNLARIVLLSRAADGDAMLNAAWFQNSIFLVGAFHIVARDLLFLTLAGQYLTERERHASGQVRILSEAIEASPLSVVITDPKGVIEYVNQRFCALTGHGRDEAIGQRPSILRSGHHPEAFYRGMWHSISNGRIWKGEMINRRKDGSTVAVGLAISPMRDETGAICRYVGIHEDISRRKEMEAQLVAARSEAEQASRAKSDFLSKMSHELRTPLNAILGFSELLLVSPRDPLNDTQAGQVRHVHQAGGHLLRLINDILDLARIEAGRLEMFIEPLDPADIAADCMALVEPLAAGAGIRLEPPRGEAWPRVRGDALRVKQVLINLLSNAIKYNRPGGSAALSWETAADFVHFAVRDDGMGIAAAKQADLFQPFHRAVAPGSSIEGSGMGLALSRQLIEHMGGRMDFTSVEGEGSCFRFTLPAIAAAPEASPTDTAACLSLPTG